MKGSDKFLELIRFIFIHLKNLTKYSNICYKLKLKKSLKSKIGSENSILICLPKNYIHKIDTVET